VKKKYFYIIFFFDITINMKKILSITFLSCFLSGCSLLQETIHRPIPLQIQQLDTQCKGILNENSNDQCGHLTHLLLLSESLDVADLLDIALRNNPTTRKIWADVRASYFNVGVAQSRLYPSADIQEIAAYTDLQFTHLNNGASASGPGSTTVAGSSSNENTPVIVSSSGPVGHNKIVIHSILFSWLLMDFGGRDHSITAAREALYSTQMQSHRSIQQVMISVLQNYYEYLGYRALVESKKTDIINDTTNFELAQDQFTAGIQTKLDTLQTRSALVSNESSLVELKASQETSWGNLMTSLGIQANVHFDVKEFPEELPMENMVENVEALIEIGKNQRSDLEASFALYRKSLNDVIVEQSAGLPTLSFQGGWQRTLFTNAPLLNQSYGAAAVVLKYPIFSGFLHENLTRRAKENAKASYASYETMKLNVTMQIVKSYYDFTAAVDRVRYSEEFLKYAQEAYDFAFSSYQEGVASIIDLLVAQKDLSKARAQRIQARTQWAVALANISFATGTL
jgi:outer membrane protein